MSRVGKLPILIPEGVEIEISGLSISVIGPLGKMSRIFSGPVSLVKEQGAVYVKKIESTKFAAAMWGTVRSIIDSMVAGVSKGFFRELEVNGVGFKASISSGYLNLSLGKSHNTKVYIPEGIKVDVIKQTLITLNSCDKELLGQYIALLKAQRPVEPYKGKGIKLKGEYVNLKEGKKN